MPSTNVCELLDDDVVSLPSEAVAAPVARPVGLHMETSYILDCSVELGEITPLEDSVFRAQTPPAYQLMDRSERNESLPTHWLRNTARDYLDSLPLTHRYVWALSSIASLDFCIQTFFERMEFIVQSKVQSDLGVNVRESLSFLDGAGPSMFANIMFASVHDVNQSNVTEFVQQEFAPAKERLLSDLQLTQDALTWLATDGNRDVARKIAHSIFQKVPFLPSTPLLREFKQVGQGQADSLKRKAQRKARSAIKKAVKLFTKTGLEDSVRLMVSGKEVVVSHPDSPFKFVLQPQAPGWLEKNTLVPGGHTPYQLTLLTKDDVFVSRLCVLFDSTPVLDQLMALTLFVESGSEQELLSKANWFGYESSTNVRSILEDKAPELLNKVPAAVTSKSDGPLGFEVFNLVNVHWEPYKGPVHNWIKAWMADVRALQPASGLGQISFT